MMDNQRGAGQEPEAPDVVARRGAPARTTGAIADDLSPGELTAQRMTRPTPGHTDESRAGVEDKALHERLAGLDNAELARLAVLEPGTTLEQGGTYVDLNDLGRGPFTAIGGQVAGPENRYVAKRDTDYELWNRLVGRDAEPFVERPE